MRTVVQRVSKASVASQKGEVRIDKGFLILLAVKKNDTSQDADYLAEKIAHLRILEDHKGKMNLSLLEEKAEALVVSQFTLYARTRKGRRPSFIDTASPDAAQKLIAEFVNRLKAYGVPVKTGFFGEYMDISLVNSGPVTVIIESQDRILPRE